MSDADADLMRSPLDDLLAVPEVPGADVKLAAMGISPDMWPSRPLTVTATRIQVHGALFELDPRGSGAVVIVEGDYGEGNLDYTAVDDLIAFRSTDPATWWRYRGEARWLGQSAIDHGADRWPDEDPPRILRTPLDWLRAGGRGCAVPLVPDAIFDLARLRAFIVRDRAFGLEIGQRLKARALEMLPQIAFEAEAADGARRAA